MTSNPHPSFISNCLNHLNSPTLHLNHSSSIRIYVFRNIHSSWVNLGPLRAKKHFSCITPSSPWWTSTSEFSVTPQWVFLKLVTHNLYLITPQASIAFFFFTAVFCWQHMEKPWLWIQSSNDFSPFFNETRMLDHTAVLALSGPFGKQQSWYPRYRESGFSCPGCFTKKKSRLSKVTKSALWSVADHSVYLLVIMNLTSCLS